MNNCVFNPNVDTKDWFVKAGIRSLKTFAQTCVSMIPVGITISEVDWKVILGTAFLSSIVSILTSISGIPEVECKEET